MVGPGNSMGEPRYLLLLNDALQDHVLRLRDADRRRLHEKLEYLAQGIWDAGVRVKKLRGSSKVIFEARMSRGDRLLFTLGPRPGGTAIYLWGLVAHDEVANAARRIVPGNAPFLSFQEMEPEEHEELILDDVPAPWLTQEDIGEQAGEESGPQRWLVLDDEEWQRLLASPDPSSFQSFLYLTREQEGLLASAPPVLVSGTAGSGKTTLSVYYLIRGAGAGKRSLFLTYNPLLMRMAVRIYRGLMEKRAAPDGTAPPRFAVFRELAREIAGGDGFPPEREVGLAEFAELFHDHRDRRAYDPELVWEEIRSIVKGAKLPLDPGRAAVLAARFREGSISALERRELAEYLAGLGDLAIGRKIEGLLSRRTTLAGLPGLVAAVASGRDSAACSEVLPRIAELVGSHAADFSRPLLSLDEYMAIGAKRAPAFRHDRAAIHGIAAYYQQRLEREGRWDEIDLTRAALRRLGGSREEPAWDLVVCDEVQDLTDVQISLIFRLARDPRSVVLTGDPRQILNPSGFRWEEVKYRFRERGLPVPEVKRLSMNFRSVGPVVRLANALLDIKQSLVGLADTEMREEWKFGGRPPVVLENVPEEEILGMLRGGSAGQAVLTRTEAEAARLRSRLGTELVFTIAQAKGLEFETAVLWRFCDDPAAEGIWRAIAAGEAPVEERLPHVRYELALLYVAVTRARGALLVWDGPGLSPLWTIPSVAALVFRTSESGSVRGLLRGVSTPEEWEAQGDYFLDREQFRAARECYRNAGAGEKGELASAFLSEREGSWGEAAPLFERHGLTARAAACREKAGEWAEALRLWEAAGDKRRARLAEANLAEAEGRRERAALLWEGLGEPARAAENWRRAGAYDRLAAAALASGDPRQAAELFEKAKKPREAAAAWEKAGKPERAGDLFLKLGDHARAARAYRLAGSEDKLLRCLRQLGDYRGAALVLERRGEVEKAVEALAAYAAVSAENRLALQAEVGEIRSRKAALKAGVRLAALGRDAEAATLLERAGQYDAAAARYERAGDSAGLARCREAQGRYLEAARALEAGGLAMSDGPRVQSLLYRHLESSGNRAEREGQALHAEAARLREAGNVPAAIARFRLLGDEESAAEAYRSLGMHEEALTFLIDARNLALARAYAGQKSTAVSWQYLVDLVARYEREDADRETLEAVRAVILRLIAPAARTIPAPEAASGLDRIILLICGRFASVEDLPEDLLRVLVDTRALPVLMRLASRATRLDRELPKAYLSFLRILGEAVGASGDARLAAIQAFGARDTKRFERLAASIPLDNSTACILGHARGTYRGAVNLLMEAGAVDEAEGYCRINEDPVLAASWAERRGDFKQAVSLYREAGDLEGALRAARASGDGRKVARALEWLGRADEAVAVWRGLGREREVERILRKGGAAPGGGDSEGAGPGDAEEEEQ